MRRKKPNGHNAAVYRESDYGPEPFVADIARAVCENENFRTALWTGTHLQTTLMSIPAGGEVGLESHPNLDQFLSVEEGYGLVKMGMDKNRLNYQVNAGPGYAIFVPAGTWHNLINTGGRPIKLYSIYAPPQHPHGTVHRNKADSDASEHH